MKCLVLTLLILIFSTGCVLLPRTSSQGNCEGVLRNGLKQGVWTCKDPLWPIISMKAFFNKGFKDGKLELFYPSGVTESISFWKNGMLDGPFKSYFPNGQPHFEMYYTNGVRSAWYYEWNEAGDEIED